MGGQCRWTKCSLITTSLGGPCPTAAIITTATIIATTTTRKTDDVATTACFSSEGPLSSLGPPQAIAAVLSSTIAFITTTTNTATTTTSAILSPSSPRFGPGYACVGTSVGAPSTGHQQHRPAFRLPAQATPTSHHAPRQCQACAHRPSASALCARTGSRGGQRHRCGRDAPHPAGRSTRPDCATVCRPTRHSADADDHPQPPMG